MSLDYVCVGSSSHAIEQNIKTGESRYIEKRIIREEKGRLINWKQKDSSNVSSKNAKKFNQNISSKVYYLLEYMKQYIPEETFTKLDYLLNEIYSES